MPFKDRNSVKSTINDFQLRPKFMSRLFVTFVTFHWRWVGTVPGLWPHIKVGPSLKLCGTKRLELLWIHRLLIKCDFGTSLGSVLEMGLLDWVLATKVESKSGWKYFWLQDVNERRIEGEIMLQYVLKCNFEINKLSCKASFIKYCSTLFTPHISYWQMFVTGEYLRLLSPLCFRLCGLVG